MRVAGLLACLLATAVAVYPESSITAPKNAASRTTAITGVHQAVLDTPLLTDAMLRSWLDSWQRRLGLTEWKIEARVVRLKELQKGTIANIHWSLPKRTATIKVLDPLDSTLSKGDVVRDTELSVVHELIHLSMAKLPLDGGDADIEEETVKRISVALMSLEKGDEDSRRARN
jgi:hypothetical protein